MTRAGRALVRATGSHEKGEAMLRFACLSMICVLFACGSAKQLYPGSPRPPEEIATLKMVTNGAFMDINGRELEGRHLALLPGTYDIKFRVIVQASERHPAYKGRNVRSTYHCQTRLALTAGHDYEISRTTPRAGLIRTGRSQTAGRDPVALTGFDLYLNRVDEQGDTLSAELIVCSEFAPAGGWERD